MHLWPLRRPRPAPPPPTLYEPRWIHSIQVKPASLSWREAVTRAAPDTMEQSRTWMFGTHFRSPDTRAAEIAVHFAWFGPHLTMSTLVATMSMTHYRPRLSPASPYVLAWSRDHFPELVERFKETGYFGNGLGLVATESTGMGICLGVWLGLNRCTPTVRMHQCDRFATFQHSTLFAFTDA